MLNHNFGVNFSIATSLTNRKISNTVPLLKKIKFPIEYGLSLSHYSRTAPRDLAPKWGQVFTLTHIYLPSQQNVSGAIYAFASNFYFPGLLKNHSFQAGFNYQDISGAYKGSREIPAVYGYEQIKATSLLKNSLLFNYRFPLAFPDKEFGPIAYIRNIRAGAFIHYENIGVENNLSAPKTFGIELRSSMNLLRYQSLADVGVRVIFVNRKYNLNPLAEFIFNFSL
ncbi:MAG: hypothetical protein EOO07_34485 [Chitinophagaceae bacterium]|nr:MAG: hypothetical protein EOO07_34485 [Chitinophagaceae bacterium]